jgi:hypothetical protein
MKILILAAILFFNGHKELTWDDFRGPVSMPGVVARTVSEIDMETTEDNGRFTFEVTTRFISEKSFTTTSDLYALSHERLHYAITELYGRKLAKIAEKMNGCGQSGRTWLESTKKRLIQDWRNEEDRYDLETDHSINREKQALWEKKIKACLQ